MSEELKIPVLEDKRLYKDKQTHTSSFCYEIPIFSVKITDSLVLNSYD